jgi:hypothetical protein
MALGSTLAEALSALSAWDVLVRVATAARMK